MFFRLASRDYGLYFPISVTITVDYKQKQRYNQQQQRRTSSCSLPHFRDDSTGCHDELDNNKGGGGVDSSNIINTAFLFLYHIAWRLHGFLDKKKAFFSTTTTVSSLLEQRKKTKKGEFDPGRKWRQFELCASPYATTAAAEEAESFMICSDDYATSDSSRTILLDRYQAEHYGGGEEEDYYWHDMDT